MRLIGYTPEGRPIVILEQGEDMPASSPLESITPDEWEQQYERELTILASEHGLPIKVYNALRRNVYALNDQGQIYNPAFTLSLKQTQQRLMPFDEWARRVVSDRKNYIYLSTVRNFGKISERQLVLALRSYLEAVA